eukprot:760900-Hanusia_phi.AAC.3
MITWTGSAVLICLRCLTSVSPQVPRPLVLQRQGLRSDCFSELSSSPLVNASELLSGLGGSAVRCPRCGGEGRVCGPPPLRESEPATEESARM